ncbi:transketolase family protein [Methanoregula sp. UBA64]|jgi:transketolase|uniref:transketolase family protein n=1 Tax=Methanoregula sp. UBA64 TaxID=1915554 RepID=UPI0025EDD9C9|nr:transketolase C-terminal domain-containing protein [Methanoregula sp. UBA64]
MRDNFSSEVTALAGADPRIVLLMADIGNHLFDRFKELYPERFFNCGIAESNMISVAAGLAMSGLRPVVYTFSAFDVGRPFEQIRVDLAFQNLPVVIIGLGGGLTYSPLGPTHYICEDLSITRSLPNMTVICPADAVETRAAIRVSLQHNGPVYIRIGKKNEPVIHECVPNFVIGKGITVKDGTEICILGTGTIMPDVIIAAKQLSEAGFNPRVVSFHTIKPLDTELLEEIFSDYSLVVTVEEHSLIGGLGAAVAEWISDQSSPSKCHLLRIGTPDEFLYHAIHQKTARDVYGLSPEKIAKTVSAHYRQIIEKMH